MAFATPLLAATGASAARFDVVTVLPANGAFAAFRPDGQAIVSDSDFPQVVNAAIDQAAQQGGGTVLIAAGDYTLDSPIRVKPGVRLVGEGGLFPDYAFQTDYPTRLRAGAKAPGVLIDMGEAKGARLEHLVVDGAAKTADCVKAAGYAIRIRDCVIRGAARRGVWVTAGVDETHDAYVQTMAINSLFDGDPIGLDVSPDPALGRRGGFTDGMVYGCRFTNCSTAGASIGGGWQFLENRLSGPNMAVGVVAKGGVSMITDSVFESIAPGPAIQLQSSGPCITGNRFWMKKESWIKTVAAPGGSASKKDGGAKKSGAPAKAGGGAKGGGGAKAGATPNAGGGNQADNEFIEKPVESPPVAEAPSPTPPHVTVYTEGGKCVAVGPDGAALESGDDAAAVINAALEKARPEGRGVVFVRAGVYVINSPVRVPADARLVGEGGMNDQGKTYHACGTILRAGDGNSSVVVDMTDAREARLEQLAVDGAHTAAYCVKMAGRSAEVRDCYLQDAKDVALWMTNGNESGPDAYAGMAVIDTLIHSSREATCLKVSKDPQAKGDAPSKGQIINSRPMMGKVQALMAGGEGWRIVGLHLTSGGGSTMGVVARSKGLLISGSYFDTVMAGPHLRVEADDVAVVGCHLGKAKPGQCIVVREGCKNLTLTANSGQQVDTLPADAGPDPAEN
ncbi:MAG: hypothetical protein NTW86_28880 [Candidatus Sumerlaeota bacterium]|nr:hypothetical protein [Candidatus Sumerlaeota bacterium]